MNKFKNKLLMLRDNNAILLSKIYSNFFSIKEQHEIDHLTSSMSNSDIQKIIAQTFNNYNKIHLTAAIMVKNQEDKIKKCINSISKIVDDINILDTGSSDKTVENIKSLKNIKINLNYRNWNNDFSNMRNYQLSTIENDNWVLVVDSDEILNDKFTKQELKLFISFVSLLYSDYVLFINLKIKDGKNESFIRPDRLFKNNKSVKYFGIVHEEPRTLNHENEKRFNSNITFINRGWEEEEMKKFNKSKNYTILLKRMISLEPNNPRWLALLPMNFFKNSPLQYIDKLLDFILIDKSKKLSISNIKKNRYTILILERYALCLFETNNLKQCLDVLDISQILYPNNTDLLAIRYFIRMKILNSQEAELLKNLLNKLNNIDFDIAYEDTQNPIDIVEILLCKLYLNLNLLDRAKALYSTFKNSPHKRLLSKEELKILTNY